MALSKTKLKEKSLPYAVGRISYIGYKNGFYYWYRMGCVVKNLLPMICCEGRVYVAPHTQKNEKKY